MSDAAFLDLVKALRELGAVRIRDGAREVAFAAEQARPGVAAPTAGVPERIDVSQSERAELEDLRAMRRRADELGVDI